MRKSRPCRKGEKMEMAELLKNAWIGWQDYTREGKLVVLLLASLLFLWFGRKHREQKALLYYTSMATACCIVPVSAVVLMLYQTKFYDYEWIWSMVPLTAVTAYGISLFWTEYCGERKAGGWRGRLPLTALLLAAVLLCGNFSGQIWKDGEGREEKQQAGIVLDMLSAHCPESNICLWAPREIMEYARETDASLRLPYGRNMWDYALNAYSYDVYDEEILLLYQWMTQVEETGETELKREAEQKAVSLEKIADYALEAGVNCVLLPESMEPKSIERMEKALGTEAQAMGDYYLLFVRT